MTDIVNELRDRAYSCKVKDGLCERAADEIVRLRNGALDSRETVQPSLTDEEREAIDRDYFAAAALTGLLLYGDEEASQPQDTAGKAYAMADAMMRERDAESLSKETRAEGSQQQPFAWAANIPSKYGAAPTVLFGYTQKLVTGMAAGGGDVVEAFPLYRHPQPALTDAEREAIEWYASYGKGDHAATLHALLERLK